MSEILEDAALEGRTPRPATSTRKRWTSAKASRAIIVGLALATLDHGGRLRVARRSIWSGPPSIPIALAVLAIAQMGVHLVFFLHITTGPDNANNVLALAFGLMVVFLVIGGSLWIMTAMNHNMSAMHGM